MRIEVIKPPKEEKKQLSIDNFVKDLRTGIEYTLLNSEELYSNREMEELYPSQQMRREHLERNLINYISHEISCFGVVSELDIIATNKLRDIATGIVPEYMDAYKKLCEDKSLDKTKKYDPASRVFILAAQLIYRAIVRDLFVLDKIGRGASFQARREYYKKTDELLGRIKDACNKLTNYAQNAKT